MSNYLKSFVWDAGHKQSIYHELSVKSGTLSVGSAVCTVTRLSDGHNVLDSVPMSKDAPGERVRVWVVIDTAGWNTGGYHVQFSIPYVKPNGDQGNDQVSYYLEISSVPNLTSTYDLSTLIGQVRVHIHDTDLSDVRWTDQEIQYFLDRSNQSVYNAVAEILEADAVRYSLGMNRIRLAIFSSDDTPIPKALMEISKRFRQKAMSEPVVHNKPLPIFVYKTSNDLGSMDVW